MADDKDRIPPHITPPPPLTPLSDVVAPPRAFVEAATPRRTARPEPAAAPPSAGPKDAVRDIVETIVFVVVLVLLLKTFIAEAFVIPTGSMATTLWGYQKVVTCPACGETFPVNCSSEVDPQSGPPVPVTGCICPNCRKTIEWQVERNAQGDLIRVLGPDWNSGDRVLVAKFLYDCMLRPPERQDVVVFKFPGDDKFPSSGPQKNHVAMNYIKRLVGKPAETIGIYYGNLYVAEGLHTPEPADDPATKFELRTKPFMHDSVDVRQLKLDATRANRGRDGQENPEKKFHIIRKPPDKIMALSRLVYDNDHQARDLGKEFQRWAPATDKASNAWKAEDSDFPQSFEHTARPGSIDWLRYRHFLRTAPRDDKGNPRPELITDFLGYNHGIAANHSTPSPNWASDLILECQVKIDAPPGDDDELWLELSKGVDRFQVRFQLKAGRIALWRLERNDQGGIRESKIADPAGSSTDPLRMTTRMRQPGTYQLRLANVDERLTVWIDNELPFGDGFGYEPPRYLGPDRETDPARNNDLQPASIGVKGAALTVSHLVLRRDTYYTVAGPRADYEVPTDREPPDDWADTEAPRDWSNPADWGRLNKLLARTLYVQPGHYLCMGDNSPESSDGREWGTVPERLLLGRALLVYYPFYWPAWPFNNPENRIRMIR